MLAGCVEAVDSDDGGGRRADSGERVKAVGISGRAGRHKVKSACDTG